MDPYDPSSSDEYAPPLWLDQGGRGQEKIKEKRGLIIYSPMYRWVRERAVLLLWVVSNRAFTILIMKGKGKVSLSHLVHNILVHYHYPPNAAGRALVLIVSEVVEIRTKKEDIDSPVYAFIALS